jgi:hypothetical protein
MYNTFFYGYREKRLAKKYYDKLFKEYCIADLSRFKENKVCPLSSYRRCSYSTTALIKKKTLLAYNSFPGEYVVIYMCLWCILDIPPPSFSFFPISPFLEKV